ncbi:hypothetical protein M514_05452 [Trichuris suis]|nr:hypothetical protein M514_05452 [Trichuris suis]
MKYMDIPALTSMGIELEQNAVDCVLDARLECYSCKMVTADKRSYRDFINTPGRGGAGNSLQPLSPPTLDDCVVSGEPSTAGCSSRTSDESSDSPTFRMCDVISNKTLFYLIETLNASFPDYTFFNASSESFTKAPSVKHFMESVNTKLMPYIKNYNMLKMYLWPVVDSAISLAGVMTNVDFSKQEEAEAYVRHLYAQYTFSCYSEKNAEGCHLLGDYHDAIFLDRKKAFELYKENCERTKYPKSCYKYGKHLLNGKLTKRDDEKAFEVLRSSCDANWPLACPPCAFILLSRKTCTFEDVQKAFDYMEKACKLEHPHACSWLSLRYSSGYKGVSQNLEKAFYYAMQACHYGIASACEKVSYFYLNGQGVPKDPSNAQKYAEMAKEMIEDQESCTVFDITG